MEFESIEKSIESFDGICNLISSHTIEEIINCLSQRFGLSTESIADRPMGGYSKGRSSGCYYFVLKDLKENLSHYQWLYARLSDERSREVFLNLIRFRVVPDRIFLKAACDKNHDQYFCPEIIHCGKEEVFVDCGGFTGDTTESFIKNYKDYKHIYIYEPSSENVAECKATVSKYKQITVRACGVGKKESEISFAQSGSSSSFIGNDKQDAGKVKIVSLDQDIAEPVSFIKMDIEGSEIDALIGAKCHIRNDHPKLAVCVYHIVSDIWEIPQIIHAICPYYRFFIRHYRDDQNWETVLYAIPEKMQTRPSFPSAKGKAGVYTMDACCGYWTNSQLTKDCGAIPYLFYKEYGYRAVMVSTRRPGLSYPCLQTAVKGMILDFLPDAENYVPAQIKYIGEHYRTMDILVLHGPYPSYFPVLNAYRKLRPDGKVYLALDANSAWMDRIVWDDPAFRQFLNQCDVIAASNKTMQKNLSIKWPYKIEYIPNGFYNFSNCDLKVDFSKKENVLLTVGRIGTTPKNNELLLEVFARIADKIPEWSLRLVGGIEDNFKEYIENYFEKYSNLKGRVTFTGNISDKSQLMAEYKRAKIFALTSRYEGTPNVIAEALYGGCYMVTSSIDAAADAVDGGRCGQIFTNGDQLSSLLIRICHQTEILEKGGHDAVEYAHHVFDYNKIIKRLHYLLFQEDKTHE